MNLLSIQIKEEFRRITTIPLERTFMHKLDEHTPKLITLMKAKGGAVGIKMRPLLDRLSQVCLFCLFIQYVLQGAGPTFFLTHRHIQYTHIQHKPHTW